jgi:hypothetical protein
MNEVNAIAEQARQKAAASGVGYANVVSTIAGHHVEVCAFRTARSAKYRVRWMVDGKSVAAARLQEALA